MNKTVLLRKSNAKHRIQSIPRFDNRHFRRDFEPVKAHEHEFASMTPNYIYPFREFVRDLLAVRAPSDDIGSDAYFEGVANIISYMAATYPDEIDRQARGAAIGTVSTYMARHIDSFDTGEIAVVGERGSLVSEHLLRAIHWLIVPAGLGFTNEIASTSKILDLAMSFEEHARQALKEAEQGVSGNRP